jgi:2'-5' RNA ligase
MKRIFIAIKVEPSESLITLMASLKSVLKDESIKWTSIGNIHITLAFLGDTDESLISDIEQMLRTSCESISEFELVLTGAGVFRSMDDPRIIWTGIGPDETLAHLNNVIMKGLKEMKIRMEERPYNPHLTIGRIKHITNKDLLKTLIVRYQYSEIQKVPVKEVILFESILQQTGPVYKPIFRSSLLKY